MIHIGEKTDNEKKLKEGTIIEKDEENESDYDENGDLINNHTYCKPSNINDSQRKNH